MSVVPPATSLPDMAGGLFSQDAQGLLQRCQGGCTVRISSGTWDCLHPVPLLSPGETHPSAGSRAGLLKTRETGTGWNKTSKCCKDGEGLKHLRCEEGLGELLSLERVGLGAGLVSDGGETSGSQSPLSGAQGQEAMGSQGKSGNSS